MKQTKIGFIPLSAWEQNLAGCADLFPNAVKCGNSVTISYCSGGNNNHLVDKVVSSGLVYEETEDVQYIINTIETVFTDILLCSLPVAQQVVSYFSNKEVVNYE